MTPDEDGATFFLCDIGLSKEGSYHLDIFCLVGLSSLLT